MVQMRMVVLLTTTLLTASAAIAVTDDGYRTAVVHADWCGALGQRRVECDGPGATYGLAAPTGHSGGTRITAWDWSTPVMASTCFYVLAQMAPHVCGSCWAEAATGAGDR